MPQTTEGRKLVKTWVRPDVRAELVAYAERTHRSLSSAAEHLIAIGLRTEGPAPDPTIHTR